MDTSPETCIDALRYLSLILTLANFDKMFNALTKRNKIHTNQHRQKNMQHFHQELHASPNNRKGRVE